MEEGRSKKRNIKPVEKSRLPGITLVVLSVLVLALLYIGYDYLTDDPGDISEVTTVDSGQEVVSLDVYNEPSEIDAGASGPVPVPTGTSKPATTAAKTSTETASSGSTANMAGKTHVHTVAANENIDKIATRYNLKPETIVSLNPALKNNSDLKVGQKVNVRILELHTVGPGDILRVVGKKYDVSVDLIMRANNKAKNYAERGEKLIIPFKNPI